jgi:hypothetical protein
MLCGETAAVCCENRTEHTDTLWAVRTSQETHHVSATESNRLMLCGGYERLNTAQLLCRAQAGTTCACSYRSGSVRKSPRYLRSQSTSAGHWERGGSRPVTCAIRALLQDTGNAEEVAPLPAQSEHFGRTLGTRKQATGCDELDGGLVSKCSVHSPLRASRAAVQICFSQKLTPSRLKGSQIACRNYAIRYFVACWVEMSTSAVQSYSFADASQHYIVSIFSAQKISQAKTRKDQTCT